MRVATNSKEVSMTLQSHGEDRQSLQAREQVNNITLKDRGASSAYKIARLDCERPDLATKVKGGGNLAANRCCDGS